MSIFPQRLKERRESLTLTQDELGAAIGKDQKAIWRYENGQTSPSVNILIDLAMTLNTTADYLLGMTDDPKRPVRTTGDLTDREREIIDILRSKSPAAEKSLLEFIKAVH